MKRFVAFALVVMLAAAAAVPSGCSGAKTGVVNVYNWGEYIDESVLDAFEEETGIRVNYKNYETNEQLYAVLKAGGANYDVIFPSDYMISRMIGEDMLEEIDFSKVPNLSKIDPQYLNLEFDPDGKYSVPYAWGTVGIIYNTSMINDDITSWGALFDEKYAGQILQFDNSRDAMAIALFYLGYSINTADEAEINEAYQLLAKQKPLLQAYVMDQIFDKLEIGEAAIGPYYAGDAITMMKENPALAFVIPSEGSNWFVDCMCIPKGAEHKDNAEAFINFMCRTDIALKNMDATGYATPSKEAYDTLDEDMRSNRIMFPDAQTLSRCQIYVNLPQNILNLYDELWVKLKS